MFSLVKSRKFQETKYDLPVVLGKTIMNEVFMFDLVKCRILKPEPPDKENRWG